MPTLIQLFSSIAAVYRQQGAKNEGQKQVESRKCSSCLKFSPQHCWLSLERKPLNKWQVTAKSEQAKKKCFLWDSCYSGEENQGPLILPKYNVWLIIGKSGVMSVRPGSVTTAQYYLEGTKKTHTTHKFLETNKKNKQNHTSHKFSQYTDEN